MKLYLLCVLLCLMHHHCTKSITPSIKEKSIVVVTCMYNNEQWVEKNLTMIFNQEYKNFRLIIVDDGSTDKTAEIIEKFIANHTIKDCITFIKNKTRKRKLANLYNILYTVKDDDIVIIIDGDDLLAHPYVFNYINNLY